MERLLTLHRQGAATLAVPMASVRDSLALNHDRWALIVPVAFAAGIVWYFDLTEEPRAAPIQFAAIVLVLCAAVGFSKGMTGLARLSLLIALLIGGIAWAQERAQSRDTVFLDRTRVVSALEGRVAWVERFETGPRVYLADLQNWPSRAGQAPPQIRIRLKNGPIPEVGSRIQVRARLSPPAPPSYPGGYDFARRAWFQEIGAVGFALSDWAEIPKHSVEDLSTTDTVWRIVNRLRQSIIDTVRDGDPGTDGAVMAALLTGDRSGIPPPVLEDLRASGLAHLLAISGLHLGLVAGTVFATVRGAFLLRSGWSLRLPTKKIAAATALIAAFCYLFLAGATIPTQRAFLMTAIVLIAVLCDRQAISLRLVAIAAGLVLLLAPESVIGPSFQLSFAAVTALVAVYESWSGRGDPEDSWPKRIGRYALLVMLTTVIAGLATAPFAIHHFGRIAHYSVLANVIAVPIVTFWVMPLGLIALLLMPFGLADGPLGLASFGVHSVLETAAFVAALPGATGLVPAFPAWGFVLIVAGGLWWAILRGTLRYPGALLLLIGLGSQAFVSLPSVVLDDSARQAGIVWQNQLWIEAPRRDRFAQRVWSEKLAVPIGGGWRDLEALPNSPMRCGPLGCIFAQPDGTSVAFVRDPRAVVEDCRTASVLRLPIHPHPALCQESLVFTPGRLRKSGATTLSRIGQGWEVDTVIEDRGSRPWTQ